MSRTNENAESKRTTIVDVMAIVVTVLAAMFLGAVVWQAAVRCGPDVMLGMVTAAFAMIWLVEAK